MKDIDFDELDRAVSSLMSGAPKVDAKDADAENIQTSAVSSPVDESGSRTADAEPYVTEEADESPVVSEPPLSFTPSETVSSDVKSTPSPSIPPSIRRRGRFMDMVRPAATESARQGSSSRPMSRQGTAVFPTDGFMRPEATETLPEGGTVQSTAAQTVSSDWNDPLEAIDFDKTSEAIEVKSMKSEPGPWQSDMQTSNKEAQELSAQALSPFLPDAKVEKRPLGGQTADLGSPLSSTQESDNSPVIGIGDDSGIMPAETSDSNADMAVPEQPLPAELGHDVMAIESAISGESDDKHDLPEPALKPTQSSATATLSPTAPSRPTFTSIPQQYKVQPKETDTSPGAIYDTATYHQPLSHPAKKQPGWLWVLTIIFILLLGAASGAAVYFFGLV